ncbi:hypothetical protein [Nocardia sp. NPDC050710]|uniref:hypothetical protein n=1 Tax=Nocardia sp. NPDC050710 TaxID=3157220 RepID=UPI00340FA6AB
MLVLLRLLAVLLVRLLLVVVLLVLLLVVLVLVVLVALVLTTVIPRTTLQPPLHPGSRCRSERFGRQHVTQVERLIGQRRLCRRRRYLAGETRRRLLCPILDRIRQRIAAPATRTVSTTQQPFGGAGDGGRGQTLRRINPLLLRQWIPPICRDLRQLDPDIEDPLLEHRLPRPTHRRPPRRLQCRLRQDLLQQLLHQDLQGDPGRGLGRRRLGRTRRRAHTRRHRGQRDGHLDREDHQRRDDDELGVLDIRRTVTDLIGEGFDVFDQPIESPLTPTQFVPVLGKRLPRRAIELAQRLLDRIGGLPVQLVQGVGELRPRSLHPPHRRLIALGPIARAHNIFRGPLQRLRNLDAHRLIPSANPPDAPG